MDPRKFVVPEICLGEATHRMAAAYAGKLNARKVLLVTDPGVARSGWAGAVIDELKAISLPYVVYDRITPNPKDHEVMAGAKVFRDEHCDMTIAVGGGSPMDCAKGIGLVASSDRHILTFEGVDKVSVPPPPLVCVPTTAGTAADVSQFAIITDTSRKVKIAIISKAAVPDASITDPLTTTTMPPDLTAATGLDALVHAFEAYVSNANSPLTDLHALEAVSLVFQNLRASVCDPRNLEARGAMMLASLHAGLAFSNASLGLVHAMAHSLGGFLDLPHGECNAILLEHVVAFNYEQAEVRYRHLAQAAGLNTLKATPECVLSRLVEALGELRRSVGMDRGLRSLGVTADDVQTLARNTVRDACLVTNPRPATVEDVERIYEQAL